MRAHLGLGGLGEAGAEGAQDGRNIEAAAVLVLVHDDGGQQQDLAVAPLVVALLHIVRLHKAKHTNTQNSQSWSFLDTSKETFSLRGCDDGLQC